jgi:hypothetical protein
VRALKFWILASFSASFCCCGTPAKVSSTFADTVRYSKETRSLPVSSLNAVDVNPMVREIAELRGWTPNLRVPIDVVRSEVIESALLADVRAQMPAPILGAQAEFLVGFGLAPPDFDLERDVLRRFAGDVSGVYCVTCRRILLSQAPDTRSLQRTLRHELVHAFQDDRYGLGEKVRWDTDRGDYIAALHALAEGEASCIARALEDPKRRGCLDAEPNNDEHLISTEFLSGVPRMVRDVLIAPYVEGTRYVRGLLLEGGWAAVESAWDGNLHSTRELSRGEPQPNQRLPALALSSRLAHCDLKYLDVVGEQQLRYLMAAGASKVDALPEFVEADRMAVWHCPDQTVAAMRLRVRGEAATEALALRLRRSLALPPVKAGISCQQFPNRALGLEWRGRDIAIASVLRRHGQYRPKPADGCPQLAVIIGQLIGPGDDFAGLGAISR